MSTIENINNIIETLDKRIAIVKSQQATLNAKLEELAKLNQSIQEVIDKNLPLLEPEKSVSKEVAISRDNTPYVELPRLEAEEMVIEDPHIFPQHDDTPRSITGSYIRGGKCEEIGAGVYKVELKDGSNQITNTSISDML